MLDPKKRNFNKVLIRLKIENLKIDLENTKDEKKRVRLIEEIRYLISLLEKE